jgi:hypothetical protein
VQVDLVEALGNDTYLSVTLAESSTLQVRIPPDQVVKIGDALWLSIAVDKIHLFDPQSGLAIRLLLTSLVSIPQINNQCCTPGLLLDINSLFRILSV